MLEKLLFSTLVMPGELARIAIALLGTAAATYYDIFNNRNIPNNLLYAFLAIAFLTNLVFFDADILLYAATLTAILFAFGFILYRAGQLGGADLFVICSISLLLPIHPSFLSTPFNYPLIFSTLLYSGVAFAVFSIFFFGNLLIKSKKAKPNLIYLSLIIPYLLFSYIFLTAPFFSPAYFLIASVLMLSAISYLVYRDSINDAITQKVRVSTLKGDEDVLAKEKMSKLMKKLKIGPVIGQKELAALKKARVKEVWIYAELPPFLPFLLVGLLASILAGDWIFLVFY
ncbi:MAG: prepilin peptidase [Candidatus Micrarchaeia archaeon]